ncbi:MAG: hypothetical protein FGM33_07645 [Candidatus Kapabacteria bacterium]|nr:hypothetical protein [Candidatus Kapabacteria bacterium]
MTIFLLRLCLLFAVVSAARAQGVFDEMATATSTAMLKNGNIISVGHTAMPGKMDGVIVVHSADLETIVASTTFGGRQTDAINDVAVAADGTIWICGTTSSDDLPLPTSPIRGSFKGATDGFVARLSADLKTVLGGMYIGGSGPDVANALAISATGDVVVVGGITSTKALPTINSFDESHNGKSDGYLICLDGGGKIVNAASYLGGLQDDEMTSVAIDSKNHAVISGYTRSTDFPTYPVKTLVWVEDGGCPYYGCKTGHWEETGEAPFDNTYGGGIDAVVLRFQLSGSIVFSAFFGGEADDAGTAVATGPDDVVYLLGHTKSKDLPIPAEVSSTFGGNTDGFYAAVSANGLKLVSAQYVGGAGDDQLTAALSDGAIVTAVGTTNAAIPEIGLGANVELRGQQDGMLVRLSSTEVKYSTITGTNRIDQPLALALDTYGDVYRVGWRKTDASSASSAFIDKYAFGVVTWRGPTTSSTLCEGSPVNVSWSADGMLASDTYSIQRSADGKTWTSIVSGLKTRSHNWTPKAEDMGGSIQMRVRASRGNVGLSPITYTTGTLASITGQPQGTMSCSGRPLTLTVATTTSDATFQWRKDGTNIAGANSATYSIANAAASASGSYDVVLTTGCGSKTSDAAVVMIADSPVITQQPTARSISAGAALELSVTAVGPGLTYQWTHNGTDIPAPEGTAATLKIASASVDRQGTYQCSITSECGRTTKSNEVSVVVTGVDEEASRSFAVWPVPASDVIHLHWEGQDVRSLVILDNTGSEMRRVDVPSSSTDSKAIVSDLASGSYTVVLETSSGRLSRRFTVIR